MACDGGDKGGSDMREGKKMDAVWLPCLGSERGRKVFPRHLRLLVSHPDMQDVVMHPVGHVHANSCTKRHHLGMQIEATSG